MLVGPVVALVAAALGAAAADASPGATPTCFGREATIVATHYEVRGTAGNDVIVDPNGGGYIEGRGGDDRICVREKVFHEIYSGSGDDRIRGGPGGDNVYPERGDDVVFAGDGADLITDLEPTGDDRLNGGPGDRDQLRFSAEFERLRPPGVVVDLARGTVRGHGEDRVSGFEEVEGTARPDRLLGDGADNLLWGVRGSDFIDGRAGDDAIVGASVLYSEDGPVDDPWHGDDGALRGGAGADRIYGRPGSDQLEGGPGPDVLDGGSPTGAHGDSGDGGPGTDTCRELEQEVSCESSEKSALDPAGAGGVHPFGPEITVVEPGAPLPPAPPGTTWGQVGPPIYGEIDAQIALQLNGYDPFAGTVDPWTTAPQVWTCWLSPYTGDEICGYR